MQPGKAPNSALSRVPRAEGLIEIDMPNGKIVCVCAGVDADALRRDLDVLDRR